MTKNNTASILHTQANIAFQDTSVARSAFTLIAAPTGRVLLMRKNDPNSGEHGKFEMPGGGLDARESYTAGVIRETHEETGYKIGAPMPVSILTHEGKRGKTELMIFVARADDEFTPEFAQNPVTKLVEHSEHRWFDLEEIKHSDDIHSKQKQDIIARYESIRSIINNAVYDSQNVDISSVHWDYS